MDLIWSMRDKHYKILCLKLDTNIVSNYLDIIFELEIFFERTLQSSISRMLNIALQTITLLFILLYFIFLFTSTFVVK